MRLLTEADIDRVSGGVGGFILLPAITAVQSAGVDAAKVAEKVAEAVKDTAGAFLATH